MRLKEFDRDKICVAADASSFYRVQVKKIAVDQVSVAYIDGKHYFDQTIFIY